MLDSIKHHFPDPNVPHSECAVKDRTAVTHQFLVGFFFLQNSKYPPLGLASLRELTTSQKVSSSFYPLIYQVSGSNRFSMFDFYSIAKSNTYKCIVKTF